MTLNCQGCNINPASSDHISECPFVISFNIKNKYYYVIAEIFNALPEDGIITVYSDNSIVCFMHKYEINKKLNQIYKSIK